MTAFTAEQIEQTAAEILEDVGPTLELADLQVVVPRVMEIVERVSEMTDKEKHETALNLTRYVLEHTDTPWLPDAASDPLFLKFADLVVIPVIAKAAKGGYAINTDKNA